MNSVLRSLYNTIIATASYSFLRLLKLSKISGYRFSSFSAAHLMTPILAVHMSTAEFLGVTALRTFMHFLMHSALGFFGLLYHMPSLAGALYFKATLTDTAKHARLIAPLACMAIFISTPVGCVAWVYSLYWLIPVILTAVPHRSVFLSALASTFMVHAVGSVLFILSTPMVPAFWFALLPVVAFERCMFAAGITGLYYAVKITQQAYNIVSARLALA